MRRVKRLKTSTSEVSVEVCNDSIDTMQSAEDKEHERIVKGLCHELSKATELYMCLDVYVEAKQKIIPNNFK